MAAPCSTASQCEGFGMASVWSSKEESSLPRAQKAVQLHPSRGSKHQAGRQDRGGADASCIVYFFMREVKHQSRFFLLFFWPKLCHKVTPHYKGREESAEQGLLVALRMGNCCSKWYRCFLSCFHCVPGFSSLLLGLLYVNSNYIFEWVNKSTFIFSIISFLRQMSTVKNLFRTFY